jgi:hypothetical protein
MRRSGFMATLNILAFSLRVSPNKNPRASAFFRDCNDRPLQQVPLLICGAMLVILQAGRHLNTSVNSALSLAPLAGELHSHLLPRVRGVVFRLDRAHLPYLQASIMRLAGGAGPCESSALLWI